MILISVEKKQGRQVVSFEGVADEQFMPAPYFAGLSGEVYVVGTLVKRISSIAIKRWITCFENAASAGLGIRFVGVSTALVEQFNAIANFGAGFPVLSAVIPFSCGSCGKPSPILKSREEALAMDMDNPPVACVHCGATALVFDDIPEEYFKFWRAGRNDPRRS